MKQFGRRSLVMVALAAGVMTSSVITATPAAAHDPSNCFHGDYRDGGWYVDYLYHFNSGSNHYNVYDHYLYGVYQHRQYLLCG